VSNPPLATGAPRDIVSPLATPAAGSDFGARLRANSEYVVIPLLALLIAAALFALFLLAIGKSPADFVAYVWRGGFGTAFSLQNTLQRSAPLILTALAVAIPARIGLIMIGGEGALVLGGFAAAALAIPLVSAHAPVMLTLVLMAICGMIAGGFWVGLAGLLRYARGVNETIASLLLTYIGIAIMNFFVEGSLRDLSNPNKPSTMPIGEAYMVGKIPGTQVHWGFAYGIILCVALYFLMTRTTFGFAARVTGGNFRAALAQGLPVGRLIVACSAIAGACAGLAGFFEVAAIQGRANASLAAGYGFTGILVSFLARHNPLVIPPVAILFGGLVASGGLIQRRMDLPDATVLVLQGLIFVVLLTSETLYGRFAIFKPSGERDRT
jgi:general nucleoside transport system permease protein